MPMNLDNDDENDMNEEYDFSGGVRAKYAERCAEGSHTVVLDPDDAAFFPNSQSVNEALRGLLEIARKQAAKFMD